MFNKLRNMENLISKNKTQYFKFLRQKDGGDEMRKKITNDIPSKTEVWSYKVLFIIYYFLLLFIIL